MQKYLLLLLLSSHLISAAPKADFAPVIPDAVLAFGTPKNDHASHPKFGIEWWYLTGQATLDDGAQIGFQVTFFRSRTGTAENNPSRFAPTQMLIAHAAISDIRVGKLLHDQRMARAGFDIVGASTAKLDIAINNWRLTMEPDGSLIATIPARGFTLTLNLPPSAAYAKPLLHGKNGYSQKGIRPQEASYYYSMPQLRTTGTLTTNGKTQKLTGTAWFDHEWSSEVLSPDAQGWDWIGVNLDDGSALMAFQMRSAHSDTPLWAAATLVTPNAPTQYFGKDEVRFRQDQFWQSSTSGIKWPIKQTISLGNNANTTWKIIPTMPNQELDSRLTTGTVYWEGAMQLQQDNKTVGRGYLEMTGYGERIKF
jgi:predicted secreted hydrolase